MQNFWALGAELPNPQPPAAGGFVFRPPLASGGWGLHPQAPKAVPIANFWIRAWVCIWAQVSTRIWEKNCSSFGEDFFF